MRASVRFRRGLSFLICLQMAIGPVAFAHGEASGNGMGAVSPAFSGDSVVRALIASLPGGEELLKSPFPEVDWGHFKKTDAILDQRPYFLEGQTWRAGAVNAQNETRVSANQSGVQIQITQSPLSLHIPVALKPLIEADEFLFFQGNDDLFRAKAGDAPEIGEGLFFVDKRDLRQESFAAAENRHGVPVMFLPLPGRGWTKRVDAVEEAADEPVLAFANAEGQTVSITYAGLDYFSKLYHQTLALIVATQLDHHVDELYAHWRRSFAAHPRSRVTFPYILPPAGSTAAFGMFATGLDLDHPERGLSEFAYQPTFIDLLFPRAHATLPPILKRSLTRMVMVTFALAVAGSTAALVTPFKHTVAHRRELVEKRLEGLAIKEGRVYKKRSRLRVATDDHVSILATSLAASEFLPKIVGGYIFEHGVHRVFGAFDMRPHPLIEGFLKRTFLNDRENSRQLSPDSHSAKLGVGVLGSEDTGLVLVQAAYVSPYAIPYVASFFSADLAANMRQQYGGGLDGDVLQAEGYRNAQGYLRGGSHQLTAEQRQNLRLLAEDPVDREMRAEGLSPIRDEKERNARIEQKIDAAMVAMHFAPQAEQLFSSPGMVEKVFAKFGYTADRKKLGTAKDEEYVLERSHHGDIALILKRAIRHAETLAAETKDARFERAAANLRETKRDYSVVVGLAKNPLRSREVLARADEVRRMLTELSRRDDDSLFGDSVPEATWRGAKEDPEVADITARIFRQSLFSVIDGHDYYLDTLKDYSIKPGANVDALAELNEARENMRLAQIEEDKKKIEVMPKRTFMDFDFGMTKRSLVRLEAKARQAVADLAVKSPTVPSLDEQMAAYKEAYRVAYLEEVGLRARAIDESDLVKRCLRETKETIDTQIAGSPSMAEYFTNLPWNLRRQELAHWHAETFVSRYVANTVNNPHVVSLTSPEQPGFFQRVRQKPFADPSTRLGRISTIALRVGESFWTNNSYDLGASSWRHRNIPMYQDFKLSLFSRFRRMPGEMLIAYPVTSVIWGLSFTMPQAFWLFSLGTIAGAFNNQLNRMQMNVGVPTMLGIWSKLAYGFIWSWLSYPLFFPFFLTVDGFTKFAATVTTHPYALAAGTTAALTCGTLLGSLVPTKFKRKPKDSGPQAGPKTSEPKASGPGSGPLGAFAP